MKTKNIFLTVALALSTTFAFAQGGIATSPHDFSGWALNGGAQASLCDACHTPHQSIVATGAPLWNHTLSSVTTYTNYPSGAGTTMDAVPGDPSGTSLLCLSCHDGTTALDSYGASTPAPLYIPIGKKVGTAVVAGTANSLVSEHPISFTYASAVATDLGLNPEADVVSAGLIALGGTVECASCHDVHNQGIGTYALLKVDNAMSALCTTCHNK